MLKHTKLLSYEVKNVMIETEMHVHVWQVYPIDNNKCGYFCTKH